ncbi:hypothetical protein [Fundidesulfovibrio terrae]|uniref:hypothetical protein n=1 Tax=Fundidesulfovibrio terrae TaxID=2922866 RepID=UPI001FAF1D70|nr:hypothetical protein [Fundidesulfovibrio terrae]
MDNDRGDTGGDSDAGISGNEGAGSDFGGSGEGDASAERTLGDMADSFEPSNPFSKDAEYKLGAMFPPPNPFGKTMSGLQQHMGFRTGGSDTSGEDEGSYITEGAPYAVGVANSLIKNGIINPKGTYIGGIAGDTFNQLSPETQSMLKERMPSYLSTLTGIGAGTGLSAAVDAMGITGLLGTLTSGVGGLYTGVMLDRVNEPLQEHSGEVYKGLLQRAASGYYD